MPNGLKPPERDRPIWQMSSCRLSSYRLALVRYLRRTPEHAERYREMQACLAEVLAEHQVRKLIDHFSGRAAMPGALVIWVF
jgi:hypothetical protein